jgi:hypothetical protein
LECFAKAEFESIEQAQEAVDSFVEQYNSARPHQALEMATPAARFYPALKAPQLEAVDGKPVATRMHEVVRKVDITGSFGLARERYSAGRWLYGELVTPRRDGSGPAVSRATGRGVGRGWRAHAERPSGSNGASNQKQLHADCSL